MTIVLVCTTGSAAAYVLARKKVKSWRLSPSICSPPPPRRSSCSCSRSTSASPGSALINNVFAVSLVYTAIYSPFAIMLLRTYFLAVPKELEEAALVDGATHWQVFTQVMLPIVSPGILTVALIIGLYSWNEFLIATTFLQQQDAADRRRLVLPALGPVHVRLGRDHGRGADHRAAGRHPLRLPATPLHRRHGGRLGQRLTQTSTNLSPRAQLSRSQRLSRTRLCRRPRQADRRLSRPSVRGLDASEDHAGARPDRVLRPRPAEPAAGRHRRRRRRHLHLHPRAGGLRHLAGPDGRGHRQGLAQLHRRGALDPVVGRQRQLDRAHRLAEPEEGHRRRPPAARSPPTARPSPNRSARRSSSTAGRWSRRASPSSRRGWRGGRAASATTASAFYAAMLWAAMEAEAFRSADIDHLLDIGLSRRSPRDCLIARLIADIRRWHAAEPGLARDTPADRGPLRLRKYPGNCHVVPNHALMIMAVLYAPDDFQRAQMIVNTSGWDTDCNAGNVGCLLGIMLGLDGLDAGAGLARADRRPDADLLGRRRQLDQRCRADRLLPRRTSGSRLAGEPRSTRPKDGAQFHFSLPGSRQGFRAAEGHGFSSAASRQRRVRELARACRIGYQALAPGQVCAVTTPTFSPPDDAEHADLRPDGDAAGLSRPDGAGAGRRRSAGNRGAVQRAAATARLRRQGSAAGCRRRQPLSCDPAKSAILRMAAARVRRPADRRDRHRAVRRRASAPAGAVLLDYLRWDGAPDLVLHRPNDGATASQPSVEGGDFWRMAWVNGVSFFSKRFPPDFRISQDRGEGIILHGTRQWTDYQVASDIVLHLGTYGGVAVRAQGLRRYYAARLLRSGAVPDRPVRDEVTTVLAETAFPVDAGKAGRDHRHRAKAPRSPPGRWRACWPPTDATFADGAHRASGIRGRSVHRIGPRRAGSMIRAQRKGLR